MNFESGRSREINSSRATAPPGMSTSGRRSRTDQAPEDGIAELNRLHVFLRLLPPGSDAYRNSMRGFVQQLEVVLKPLMRQVADRNYLAAQWRTKIHNQQQRNREGDHDAVAERKQDFENNYFADIVGAATTSLIIQLNEGRMSEVTSAYLRTALRNAEHEDRHANGQRRAKHRVSYADVNDVALAAATREMPTQLVDRGLLGQFVRARFADIGRNSHPNAQTVPGETHAAVLVEWSDPQIQEERAKGRALVGRLRAKHNLQLSESQISQFKNAAIQWCRVVDSWWTLSEARRQEVYDSAKDAMAKCLWSDLLTFDPALYGSGWQTIEGIELFVQASLTVSPTDLVDGRTMTCYRQALFEAIEGVVAQADLPTPRRLAKKRESRAKGSQGRGKQPSLGVDDLRRLLCEMLNETPAAAFVRRLGDPATTDAEQALREIAADASSTEDAVFNAVAAAIRRVTDAFLWYRREADPPKAASASKRRSAVEIDAAAVPEPSPSGRRRRPRTLFGNAAGYDVFQVLRAARRSKKSFADAIGTNMRPLIEALVAAAHFERLKKRGGWKSIAGQKYARFEDIADTESKWQAAIAELVGRYDADSQPSRRTEVGHASPKSSTKGVSS